MLILARKKDERVVIHDNGIPILVYQVMEITPSKVRIGFSDNKLSIDRQEIYEQKYGRSLPDRDLPTTITVERGGKSTTLPVSNDGLQRDASGAIHTPLKPPSA